MQQRIAVILAAGEGKRMKSSLPKVLHRLCGRTLLGHVLGAVDPLCAEKIVVVGHGADSVRKEFGDSVRYAHQERQLGTGHAVMQAAPLLPPSGLVFVLCGDTPLLTVDVLRSLQVVHEERGAAATVLTSRVPEATGYGRIVRDTAGGLSRIIEDRDATGEERKIDEINTGVYLFEAAALHDALPSLRNDNSQEEYYLTDVLQILLQKGLAVAACCVNDWRLALGINDRAQLAEAETLLRARINTQLMLSGVTMVDPETTYVDAGVHVGRETVLLPGTLLLGHTTVGEGCAIGPHTEIRDSVLGSSVVVRHSVITGSVLDDDVSVGPFAHLRPETRLHTGVKVGDFVEIKKSDIGRGSKIPHLSYVGDAEVGCDVNLGAGTIVVNYDGRQKHVTRIGDRTFIGCNSNLVAPLSIGEGAFVAAGSTVTRDVPAEALALGRVRQINKEKMAARFLQREEEG
ncbi:MAG: bifunctional UDP-N-acetylglucosamine diphosphorylase/glucosamine-1-phosphate N-acetyltransferase GlmU [Dethiobacter sp.]|nr:bifunctional UDP-N-acetylglucosamine diphosphorylase/glucosamine-1-phosphate N-acetyltransferase GlmU [Dethiobacter sp.]